MIKLRWPKKDEKIKFKDLKRLDPIWLDKNGIWHMGGDAIDKHLGRHLYDNQSDSKER